MRYFCLIAEPHEIIAYCLTVIRLELDAKRNLFADGFRPKWRPLAHAIFPVQERRLAAAIGRLLLPFQRQSCCIVLTTCVFVVWAAKRKVGKGRELYFWYFPRWQKKLSSLKKWELKHTICDKGTFIHSFNELPYIDFNSRILSWARYATRSYQYWCPSMRVLWSRP